ncbi:MAG: DUF2095 family protein [Candidatus Caldarchaeum sp.]|jgi:hypothetical protein
MDVEEFRRRFPNLYREIVERRMAIRVSGVRNMKNFAEEDASSKTPSVIDYLRRCDTDDQGREVINYLRRRGEISKEAAESLLKQLDEKGIRSFGSRKQPGHYLREGL